MTSSSTQSTPTTYFAIFSACGESKLRRLALGPHEMHSHGLQADVITYGTTFSACGKSELWHHAMEPREFHSQGPRQS